MANNKLILGVGSLILGGVIGGIAYLASTQNKQDEQFDRTPSNIIEEINKEDALRDSLISEYSGAIDSLGQKYNWNLPLIDRCIAANPNLNNLEKEVKSCIPSLPTSIRIEVNRKRDSISNEMYRNLMKPRPNVYSSGAPGD